MTRRAYGIAERTSFWCGYGCTRRDENAYGFEKATDRNGLPMLVLLIAKKKPKMKQTMLVSESYDASSQKAILIINMTRSMLVL